MPWFYRVLRNAAIHRHASAGGEVKGHAKIEAMAEVPNTIVQQRNTTRDLMMNMQRQMMGHMMQHVSAGMSPDMKKMMDACPTMKQMGVTRED